MESIVRKLNFKQLHRRERYIITGATCLIGAFIIVQLIVLPLFNRKDRLHSSIKAKTQVLMEMRRLQSEYETLNASSQKSMARFGVREKGFRLFSFLDRLAKETGIKGNVIYMKPTIKEQPNSPYKLSRVEMKADAVTLKQLTTYLHGVETSKNMITIRKLSISKKSKNESLITAILQIETLEM